ncbi:hypothetical protein AXG93_2334s1190 [Marchantia polymorpha subsp. ruderalis]|uniref:Uncharacterized protein n=1 Tax=Marchantia polymorpha subsp. ruderalis TaxID=1480154 RepID=A0A176W644_MARPO|nr:hypothetical protein AXG93_2334s1190 [Marchantia polymorpha subsp. ruderalis]
MNSRTLLIEKIVEGRNEVEAEGRGSAKHVYSKSRIVIDGLPKNYGSSSNRPASSNQLPNQEFRKLCIQPCIPRWSFLKADADLGLASDTPSSFDDGSFKQDSVEAQKGLEEEERERMQVLCTTVFACYSSAINNHVFFLFHFNL